MQEILITKLLKIVYKDDIEIEVELFTKRFEWYVDGYDSDESNYDEKMNDLYDTFIENVMEPILLYENDSFVRHEYKVKYDNIIPDLENVRLIYKIEKRE